MENFICILLRNSEESIIYFCFELVFKAGYLENAYVIL